MTRMSPAVARTVSIMNFLADHPGKPFTMTDIVKALKISRATCHALLSSLVDAGYLYRTSEKAYVLGPALARVARAAQQGLSPMQIAEPEMRALADEFDAVCAAVVREKDETVVRQRTASLSHLGWCIAAGARATLRPPFGTVFMAWSDEAEIEAWLSRMSPPPGEAELARIRAGLELPRALGFAFGVRTVHVLDEQHAQSLRYRTDMTDYLVGTLERDRDYDLAFVTAPVFDDQGRVAFVLALIGFVRIVPGHEVEAIGRRLRDSCDRISAFIGGRSPDHPEVASVADPVLG